VLVYHRVSAGPPPTHPLAPFVPEPLFRRQVEVLGEIGEIVSLQSLIGEHSPRGRPKIALTFDDDYITHFEHVLPTLNALGATGTFFLSGRQLHGLGSHWFELLEQLLTAHGVGGVARMLDLHVGSPRELAAVCEGDFRRQRLIENAAVDVPRHLRRDHIRSLAEAGMSIGFHTLHHRILTMLSDVELKMALVDGRQELARVAGGPLRLFAYPHGKADERAARHVRSAGYTAAWTGLPRPIGPGDDRYLLGRWEPGALGIDDFLVKAVVRLNRAAPLAGHRTRARG
jgi:peptidoglycan/xylan/chitin deacetylase (PgdA/CDA1 family)